MQSILDRKSEMENQEHICEQLGRPRTLLELCNSQNKDSGIQHDNFHLNIYMYAWVSFSFALAYLAVPKGQRRVDFEMQVVRHKLKDDGPISLHY